ncbi:MAG: 3-dehydroquinate synthase [Pirellulales bacterium]
MALEELSVKLGDRSYSIVVGEGVLQQIATRVRILRPKASHAVIIFDSNVAPIAKAVESSLGPSWRIDCLEIPSGEGSKSITQLSRLWEKMLTAKTDRGSLIIAIGGGVVGDLAGFAAASFARGLTLIQIPTSLLSQVDSSVGGKTGINLDGAKNIVGAFWQPALVMIDSQTLNSLPEREYISGLAEIVKYGVILLPELFEFLEQNVDAILAREPAVVRRMVIDSCRAKAMVVENDERETTGLRAILNYGHTFAHAIEATEGYGSLLHGEAVAIGMNMAAELALRLGRVDRTFVERQAELMRALKLPVTLPKANVSAMWQVMQSDKKVEHGMLRFVLPTRMGHVELVSQVEKQLALDSIESCLA